MNIHHLELFYYVARHGGISEAVRNIPYGIQQPAVSGQIIQLEAFLGVTLFQRRPFQLTPAGEKLFRFIQPFFGGLEGIAAELQGGVEHHLRIGASEIVMREHLPALLQMIKKQVPQFKFTLREGYQPQVEKWLEEQEIDVALTLLTDKEFGGFQQQVLLKLPLMLLVAKGSRLQSAEELWKRDQIEEPLITLPAYEAMCRNFQQGLARKGIDWFPSVEISSLDLIQTYVANGYGIGLFLDIPKLALSPKVRSLPLADFDPVSFGALWRGTPSALVRGFLEAAALRARELANG